MTSFIFSHFVNLLYTEIRAGIPYVFEQRKDYLTILYELFLEVYTCFEGMSEEAVSYTHLSAALPLSYYYRTVLSGVRCRAGKLFYFTWKILYGIPV